MESPNLDQLIASATLGVDTLWGGDVMSASGVGRSIADSWFADQPLPTAYTHPLAAKLRASQGVNGTPPDRATIDAYLKEVDVRGSILAIAAEAQALGGARGKGLAGLALCFEVMWDLAMELLEKGPAVPYDRCVRAVTGAAPSPSTPDERRRRVADLLKAAGYFSPGGDLLAAAEAWRAERMVPRRSIPALGAAFIAQLDALTVEHVLPHLPRDLARVPRANVVLLPIENAWFSGSMNYIGRARNADGSPQYEATYEINAGLEISVPEFQQLISHEVVPGHVTTFAYLQDMFVRRKVGFEASVLTMNTRGSVLFEGIANNAILMAYGVLEESELPDRDLELGCLLALLQDDAKNQASYSTWHDGLPQPEVAAILRRDFLVSEERAEKLSGPWGRNPLSGRMYLPSYRFGTELVARLRREHPAERVLPALFGCKGLVDVVTIQETLQG
jgi:hypothetical protein